MYKYTRKKPTSDVKSGENGPWINTVGHSTWRFCLSSTLCFLLHLVWPLFGPVWPLILDRGCLSTNVSTPVGCKPLLGIPAWFLNLPWCLLKWPHHIVFPPAMNSSYCSTSSWAFDVVSDLDSDHSNRHVTGGLACCNSRGGRVRHDWATELNWTKWYLTALICISLITCNVEHGYLFKM